MTRGPAVAVAVDPAVAVVMDPCVTRGPAVAAAMDSSYEDLKFAALVGVTLWDWTSEHSMWFGNLPETIFWNQFERYSGSEKHPTIH